MTIKEAFNLIMDGTNSNDLVKLTGLPKETCCEIWDLWYITSITDAEVKDLKKLAQ